MSVLLVRPDELRQAGRALRRVGEQLDQVADRAGRQVEDLGQAWTGLAALERQARAVAVQELVRLTARPGRAASEVLERAAGAAEEATARVRAWSRRLDECQAELATLRALGPPPDPLLEQLWRRRLHQVDEELDRARCLVEEAEQEWREVERDVAAVVAAAWSVVTELDRSRQVLQPVLRTVGAARRTTRSAAMATATLVALARARWRRSAAARDRALRRARVWLRRLTTGRPGSGREWTVLRGATLAPGPVGWVLTYLGAIQDVRTGGGRPGWRGEVTRLLAAGALVGGPLLLAGLALPPLGLVGIAAVSTYQLWTAGNLVWDNRASLARYARRAAETLAHADRALQQRRARAHIRLARALDTLRDARAGGSAPSAPPLPVGVGDVLVPVLRRGPGAEALRERWGQVGEPLRLPWTPLPPGLPQVDLGSWRTLPVVR